MSDKTKIEWSDATWNPITGCTKVSEGCRNCYAHTFAERWRGTKGHYFENGFDITLRPDKLDKPLKWTKPRKIFVNSMSDLFHESIDDKFIAKVFGIMWLAQQHTFQVLTKRPERMAKLLNDEDFVTHTGWFASQAIREYGLDRSKYENLPGFPNPNIWLGTSTENQKTADERIPHLLATPAAVRFLSCEPLLDQIDFNFCKAWNPRDHEMYLEGIDWIIAGGESGPKARPMHPEWLRLIRDQCQETNTAFFFKQWGEWLPRQSVEETRNDNASRLKYFSDLDMTFARMGKSNTGRLFDFREWNEFPLEVKQ